MITVVPVDKEYEALSSRTLARRVHCGEGPNVRTDSVPILQSEIKKLQRDFQMTQQQSKQRPLPLQTQSKPGLESQMTPRPEYMARDYRGSDKLKDKVAIIMGGDFSAL